MTFGVVLLKIFATFYFAVATVDFVSWITGTFGRIVPGSYSIHGKEHWIDRKPFNCVLCMCGWIAIPMWFVPWDFVYGIPALAGMALILHAIRYKLETLVG